MSKMLLQHVRNPFFFQISNKLRSFSCYILCSVVALQRSKYVRETEAILLAASVASGLVVSCLELKNVERLRELTVRTSAFSRRGTKSDRELWVESSGGKL